jgi:hypothetical protein
MRQVKDNPRRRFLQRLLAASLLPMAGFTTNAWSDGNDMVRRLRINLGFRNPLPRELRQQRFWCYLPFWKIPCQRLVTVHVSTGHRLLKDRLGHNILALDFDRISPFTHKLVSITCELALNAATAPNLLMADTVTWLRPERHVESDDPEIRKQAATFRRNTPMDSAFAIYEWIRANIDYAGYIAPDLGARYALAKRRGDCTEFSCLVVAFARALGIPARVVGGYVTDRDFVLRPDLYHNWAELHIDDAWRIVDAQKGNWLASSLSYIAFHVHSSEAMNDLGFEHRYRMEGDLQVET